MKLIIAVLLALGLMSGCSQKEFSDGANDAGNDVGDFGDKIFKQR